MNDQKIILELGLINATLTYLGTRPYQEVAQLIHAIQEQTGPQVKLPEAVTAPAAPATAE